MAEDPQNRFALFLDFDGTLVDIAERPEAVLVEPGLPTTLARLRDRLDGALALVSGRPIKTLDRFLDPERFDAAGLHGLEQRVAGELFPCDPATHPELRRAVANLHLGLDGQPGVIIEDKGCSVAIHWRLRPDFAGEATAMVEREAERLAPRYRLQLGKAVAELLPAHAGKGPVIEWFLQRRPYRGRRPIFIGDDLTDEHGFAAVNRLDGLSVRVGDGDTIARHRIRTPADVRHRLARWAASGAIRFDEEIAA